MNYRVNKDAMRNNRFALKRGDVFRVGEYVPTEDNYFMLLDEIHKGPEDEDNYYRIWNLQSHSISEVNCAFLESQVCKCEAVLDIKDNE